MKYLLLFTASIFICGSLFSQSAVSLKASNAADKLKDNLQLSESVRNEIYQINLGIYVDKYQLTHIYVVSDSLFLKNNQIECRRDSLYKLQLTPGQYQLYQRKKRVLLNEY